MAAKADAGGGGGEKEERRKREERREEVTKVTQGYIPKIKLEPLNRHDSW